MNHSCALQHKVTGKWAYCRNAIPTGYCDNGRHMAMKPEIAVQYGGSIERYEEEMKPHREAFVAGKYHDGGHETEEEAQECYKQYVLDFRLRFQEDRENASQQHRCEVCKAWTSGYVQIGAYRMHMLCAEHRNRDTVATLFDIGESWES